MTDARLRRLADELGEAGLALDLDAELDVIVLAETDYALRPHVFERRVPSVGTIIEPAIDPARWEAGSGLRVTRRPVASMPVNGARLFADGLASWLIRRVGGDDEWAVFDRPAGSERDLVVLGAAAAATIVQRHPNGSVRIVGEHGVLRWDGLTWLREPPISTWIDSVTACGRYGGEDVLELLLGFAVHDLGARGIGAILVFRPDEPTRATIELRLPTPPPLDINSPFDLAPLRHALSQTDGAAVFDARGVLGELGVRLLPTPEAVSSVEGFRGMRHTSARRYSYDDPRSTVIVVSEDGPVTVLRNGELLGHSR
jgi:hypothetical protein